MDFWEGELKHRSDSSCEARTNQVAKPGHGANHKSKNRVPGNRRNAAWATGDFRTLARHILLAAFRAGPTGRRPKPAKAVAKPASADESLPPPVKVYGSKSAPITMEVFTDYQCPSCRAFYEQTLRQLINAYVADGKVYLVHRDFPLPMHKYSFVAARWANAAARVGQFSQAESSLYDNQDLWEGDGNIARFVSQGMSAADFKRVQKLMEGCTALPGSPEAAGHVCALDSNIAADQAIGNQVPVEATPTFVIHYKGQKYPPASGVVSWTVLKQFFDQLLKQ